jgi:hypothetical protein
MINGALTSNYSCHSNDTYGILWWIGGLCECKITCVKLPNTYPSKRLAIQWTQWLSGPCRFFLFCTYLLHETFLIAMHMVCILSSHNASTCNDFRCLRFVWAIILFGSPLQHLVIFYLVVTTSLHALCTSSCIVAPPRADRELQRHVSRPRSCHLRASSAPHVAISAGHTSTPNACRLRALLDLRPKVEEDEMLNLLLSKCWILFAQMSK